MTSHHLEDSARHSEMLFETLVHMFYYIDSILPIHSSYNAQLQKKVQFKWSKKLFLVVDIMDVAIFTFFTTEYIVSMGTPVGPGLAIQITHSFTMTMLKRPTPSVTTASLSTLMSIDSKSVRYITPVVYITMVVLIPCWTTWRTKVLSFGVLTNLTEI